MDLENALKTLAEREGSDLYFSTGAPVSCTFHGTLEQLDEEKLGPGVIEQMANSIMDEEQQKEFSAKPEMNLAISRPGMGRFRVNIFRQRNQVSMMIRLIGSELPNYKDLGLPAVLPKLSMSKLGLILFVGGTGSGKSTSLTALIDYRNENSKGHIITIEDPVEFTHPTRAAS